MKVHVTLQPQVREDPGAKTLALRKLEQRTGIRGVNQKRFERYGIISGELDDPAKLDEIREMSEVKAAEPDEKRHASDNL